MDSHIRSLGLAIFILYSACSSQRVVALDCAALVQSTARSESVEYSHGNLWRIDALDGHINYLFGTIHLTDPRVTQLPSPVAEALDNSDIFGMEVVLDSDAIVAMSQAMRLVDGNSLQKILGLELFESTAELLGRYGVTMQAIQSLKPWAAFATLSLPPAQSAVPLDMLLMFEAQRQGKPIFGLEVIDEQIAVLDTLTDSDQLELLRRAVCHYDEFQADIETMVEHYIARDLGAVMRMALRYRSPLQDRFLDALLWQRNRRMVAKMVPRLDTGGAFIAIGALHLPGPGGVLDILSKRGYSIESIH